MARSGKRKDKIQLTNHGGTTRVGQVETQLSGSGSVSELCVDDVVEVTETVSRELSENGDHKNW